MCRSNFNYIGEVLEYFFFLQNVVYDYTVKMSSRNIFFSPVQPNLFLQDSESK